MLKRIMEHVHGTGMHACDFLMARAMNYQFIGFVLIVSISGFLAYHKIEYTPFLVIGGSCMGGISSMMAQGRQQQPTDQNPLPTKNVNTTDDPVIVEEKKK